MGILFPILVSVRVTKLSLGSFVNSSIVSRVHYSLLWQTVFKELGLVRFLMEWDWLLMNDMHNPQAWLGRAFVPGFPLYCCFVGSFPFATV